MVYVDHLFTATPRTAQARRHGRRWCHMIADTHDELMAMAARIGLEPWWIEDAGQPREHFNMTPSRRALAVRYGAVEVSDRELVQKIRDKADAHKRAEARRA